MGMRTLVVFNNDHTTEWENDLELGRKIAIGMNHTHDQAWDSPADLRYARVLDCTHGDTQTLAVIDNMSMTPMAYGLWSRFETAEQVQLRLLRQAADKLGFRLVKKSDRQRTGGAGT